MASHQSSGHLLMVGLQNNLMVLNRLRFGLIQPGCN